MICTALLLFTFYFRTVSLAKNNNNKKTHKTTTNKPKEIQLFLFKDFIYPGTNSTFFGNQGICWSRYVLRAPSHQVKHTASQQSHKQHRRQLHYKFHQKLEKKIMLPSQAHCNAQRWLFHTQFQASTIAMYVKG